MQQYRIEDGHDEDCGICMEKMKVARLLRCGHKFHLFCLMQMIINGKSSCPICRADIYTGRPMSHSQPQNYNRELQAEQEGQPNLNINGAVQPQVPQNSTDMISLGNAHMAQNLVSEAAIERVREECPTLLREQIIQILQRAGSPELAIIMLSDSNDNA